MSWIISCSKGVIFKDDTFLLRERIMVQPKILLSHTGQLIDPDGASGQLRTSMLLTGSRFLRRFEMLLWCDFDPDWQFQACLLLSTGDRDAHVLQHIRLGERWAFLEMSMEICSVIACQFVKLSQLQLRRGARSLRSKIPRRPEESVQGLVSERKPFKADAKS